MEQIKILLVDDETLLTDSLEIILSLTSEYKVIGKAKNGIEALAIMQQEVPTLALVDLNMEQMGGIELIRLIKQDYPMVKILVLTTFYDKDNIAAALTSGANGYLLKDSGREAMLLSIRNIVNGQSVLDSKVLEQLTQFVKPEQPSSNQKREAPISNQPIDTIEYPVDLTKRELEICSMLAEGYTNRQIASFLFISEGTVKNYISSIYDKYQIHDRAALVVALRKP